MNPKWLDWANQLAAIAQNGLTFNQNHYDVERYEAIRRIAAEMVAAYSDLDFTVVQNIYKAESGYTTPKVDVRAAVFKDDKILLVKEEDGGWSLPGGWADIGDAPSAAVEREVYEEAGYYTQATKLLAFYDRNDPRHAHPPYLYHVYKVFFRCELLSDAPVKAAEIEAGFFAADALPPLSLTRNTSSEVARLFEHYRNPALPTDFD